MGASGLAARLGIEQARAADFIDRWWQRFPAVRVLRDSIADEPRLTPWGRRLPDRNVPDHIRLNHLVQGSARDIFCDGLLALEDAGLDEHLLLPLHDELVIAVPEDTAEYAAAAIADLVRSELDGVNLPVSWKVGGRSWASVKGSR
jgi:DNA polymerase I-like protein with 3'-5' exonuclease and polymerase domains